MEPDDLHKWCYFINQYKNKHCSFYKYSSHDSDDNLQTEVFTLQNVANNFEMEISPEQSETMAFSGQDPVRCKITV